MVKELIKALEAVGFSVASHDAKGARDTLLLVHKEGSEKLRSRVGKILNDFTSRKREEGFIAIVKQKGSQLLRGYGLELSIMQRPLKPKQNE